MFEYNQALIRETLDCDELKEYIEPVNICCGEQDLDYSSIYKLKKGWDFLQDPNLSRVLKIIHTKLEERYIEVLKAFTGKETVPDLNTRHILLPQDIIEGNIDKSKMKDEVKMSLISLSKRLESITPEQFKKISQNPEMRDTFISLRWLAYSLGIFSNEYIDVNKNYKDNDVYMNVTARMFTKIGGASLMNFPENSLTKIDRGEGNINQKEFDERMEFQHDFYKKCQEER